MQQKITVLALAISLATALSAQKEWAYQWHFGDRLALDFSSGAPVLSTNSEMQTAEGCASISDDAGNHSIDIGRLFALGGKNGSKGCLEIRLIAV